MQALVCTKIDDFIEEKPLWCARLSNGETVYQDDERPNCIASAWKRLAMYVKICGVRITELYLKFRSNIIVPLDSNCDGYFFRNKAKISLDSPTTHLSYLVGQYKKTSEKLLVKEYMVPTLEFVGQTFRDVNEAAESLILNE